MEAKENVSIEKIGKKEADDILKNNFINRRVNRANVDFIKHEMLHDNFCVNGASIVISEDNILVDGQHRLIAISETDLSFNMIIVRNVKKEVFSTIDCGRPRTSGDVFNINNIPHANTMASAINRIKNEFLSKRKAGKNVWLKFSNEELLSFYYANKDELDELVLRISSLYAGNIKTTTTSIGVAMIFLLKRENKQKAYPFVRELFKGVKEYESNAAQTLRNRLLNYKIDGIKIDDSQLRAFFIVAFRAYKENRDISKLVITKNLYEYLFKAIEE